MPTSEARTAATEGARFHRFTEDVFRSLHRVEQRRWARAYLWALIHGSGKKTPRHMARSEALPASAIQGLHQFINASPWDWRPVRRRLALRVAASAAPYAWTVAELIIPKTGKHSVGVHRRLDPVTGREVNCQRALGLYLAGESHSFPVDWSLVLSGPWDWDPQRRRRSRIPEEERERPVGAYVLDHAADAVTLPHVAGLPWVLDLTRCDDAAGVLAGLARERLDVVCEVDPGQVVLVGQHTPTVSTVGAVMGIRHARQPHVMVQHTREGGAKAVPIYAYADTVRLPQLAVGADGAARTYRILERPASDGRVPARYWITSLTDRPVDEVLSLVRGRTAALSAVKALQDRFGVLDFEGRSFPGWHHHMTMASAAYVYQYLDGASGRDAVSSAAAAAQLSGAAS
ncbi:IS701 family transposase [Streptomyces sp. NPDC003753]|uniref:IS701 family transposase n=1 Tax=Streptomyces sp. Y2F8-2 TaxID=2759675 RepID=UPI0019064B96|nr:transposase [Streptomyces sp. Y2F8-2]